MAIAIRPNPVLVPKGCLSGVRGYSSFHYTHGHPEKRAKCAPRDASKPFSCVHHNVASTTRRRFSFERSQNLADATVFLPTLPARAPFPGNNASFISLLLSRIRLSVTHGGWTKIDQRKTTIYEVIDVHTSESQSRHATCDIQRHTATE